MFEFLAPILPYLPQHEGLLPKWLFFCNTPFRLFVSFETLANSLGLNRIDRKLLPSVHDPRIHFPSLLWS